MRSFFILFLLASVCAAAMIDAEHGDAAGARHSQTPEPGVGRELARRRADHYRDVRYDLRVSFEPGASALSGVVKINFTRDAAAGDLVLDWRVAGEGVRPGSRVSAVTANGKRVGDARFINDHIIISASHLVTGANAVEMSFESPVSASGSAVTRYLDREDNSEYVYTLFVPSDASTVFPCFDQPDLKARFRLTVSAPTAWKVVGNEPAETVTRNGAWSIWRFGETPPISTYIFAFAAGPFEEFADDASPYRTRLFVRKSKKERAQKELAEVFRLNREGLRFFESYFGHKFPFTKYDLVVLPQFPFRGMEHAGATFLREETILFPTDPTTNDLVDRAEVILHEAAHQWFGDLVTMRWFDDLWLKEGFATFMAYKALVDVMPDLDAWKTFHVRTKPLAYLTDASKGTTPIRQEIPNLSAAKSAYGNIVYRKAPSLLRQAEFYLGAEEFERAVRALVKEHAYGNAEWGDLVRAFERASGRKLDAWADAWVKRRGMPVVSVRRDGSRGVTLEQQDALGEGGLWPMRLEVLTLSFDGAMTTNTVRLEDRTARFETYHAPDIVFSNSNDFGYGLFLLDAESRAKILERPELLDDEFVGTLLLGSLWESVRRAEMSSLQYVELAARVAPQLGEEITLQPLLSRVQTAFTRYLSDAQRAAVAPRLEAICYERMMHAETRGLRITYFRAYREVAATRGALDNLVKILEGDLKVPGMTLGPRDRFDIIHTLTAAGDGRAAALLRKHSEEDESDDARRYAFAAGAARPSAAAKKKYFDAFITDSELAESWVEAAIVPFNSPRQSALTLPYLEPALAELPRLKRTRKIFFVNGWLAAFVGGQCEPRAVEMVNDFLGREHALDRDLRLKVLEAADALERCVCARARYGGEDADTLCPAP